VLASLLPTYSFRLVSKFPVVKLPLSPMPPRHSILNWPSTALPSRFNIPFNSSNPSPTPCCCVSKYAN
jgi:hypothetical protein